MSRYTDSDIIINDHQLHNKMLEKRGLKQLTQHASNSGFVITEEDMAYISYTTVQWSMGMNYRKLAHVYYGSADHWWVIALFNKKPTAAHVKLGARIKIPDDLGEILGLITNG
tara:strand:+ start:1140 stop:1478 length:339 start_codon:yes stop_codon:yes gene_type:complete